MEIMPVFVADLRQLADADIYVALIDLSFMAISALVNAALPLAGKACLTAETNKG